jgi:hypothetical protein
MGKGGLTLPQYMISNVPNKSGNPVQISSVHGLALFQDLLIGLLAKGPFSAGKGVSTSL